VGHAENRQKSHAQSSPFAGKHSGNQSDKECSNQIRFMPVKSHPIEKRDA